MLEYNIASGAFPALRIARVVRVTVRFNEVFFSFTIVLYSVVDRALYISKPFDIFQVASLWFCDKSASVISISQVWSRSTG